MDTSVKVLLIEDDEDDYILTRDLLQEIRGTRYRLDWISTFDGALEQIARRAHDVYLLDYRLGEHTGLELLRLAIAGGLTAPMILLTGQSDRQIDLEAMEAGAADFLTKGQISAPLLERSIRYSLQQARIQEDLRRKEEQLRHAQKLEAVGRLAGGVAHDFNNLLTAIGGYSELVLSMLPPDSEATGHVQEIRRAAERATALTAQLLTFSCRGIPRPGHYESTELRVVGLHSAVREIEPMLTRLIGENIELVVTSDPCGWNVRADRAQLDQVVLNLALNARDAMPDGGRLMLSAGGEHVDGPRAAELGLPPGDYATLRVSDTGCGMDADTLSRIFDPFFTTKAPDRGTGLGLSTVWGILRQAGGHVAVTSRPGQGTTFTVYWPRAHEEAPPHPQPASAAAPDGRGLTVLLVEDQQTVRRLVSRILRGQGYHVLEACHGAEALRICREFDGEIHLVVTDVIMPQMGGKELARRLAGERPETRILYISGYSADDPAGDTRDDPHLSPAPAHPPRHHFLQKPFTIDALTRKVRQVLDTPGPSR